MKLRSPRNHLDVAMMIFCALRKVGIEGMQLRSSHCHRSPSRYIFMGKHAAIRVSNHQQAEPDARIQFDLIGTDIPAITQKAIVWLEQEYGIEVQTTG